MSEESKTILHDAKEMQSWLISVRRDFHQHPELGLEEHRTAGKIVEYLEEMGVAWTKTDTAVVGLLRGAKPGKTVGLRADIDALPIREEIASDFESKNPGIMHACGHDAHAAMLLGAARWFSQHKERMHGNVKFFFQPAEETVGGAETMIQNGCLEDPYVDAVFGLHVMPYLNVGQIESKKGALNGSSVPFSVLVEGKSGHGAYPETGIDAINAAVQVISAMNTLVSRYVSPLESAVISIGRIAGGQRPNILADNVEFSGILRSTNDTIRDMLLQRMQDIVEGVAAALGAKGSFRPTPSYTSLVNHDAAVDLLAETAEALLGAGAMQWKEKPSMGVEDFSFFVKERFGAFYHLGCGNAGKSINEPLHSSSFVLNEDCLPLGVAMHVGLITEYWKKFN